MARKNRRRRRKKRSNIDFGKVFIFLLACAIIIFAAVVILSKLISHKDRYFDEGLTYYQNSEYDKALDKFTEALSEKQIFSQNKDKNTRLYIADIYMKTADYKKAVDEYDTILQKTSADKKDVKKMQEIAQALSDFSDSNYAGALPVLEQYVKDYPELYLYIGTCYASMDDSEHMFENYEKYIKNMDIILICMHNMRHIISVSANWIMHTAISIMVWPVITHSKRNSVYRRSHIMRRYRIMIKHMSLQKNYIICIPIIRRVQMNIISFTPEYPMMMNR